MRRYFPTPEAWKPEYEKLARMHYAWTLSGDWPRLAMVRALLQQQVYIDPVVYDWAHIKSKALVFGGDDRRREFPGAGEARSPTRSPARSCCSSRTRATCCTTSGRRSSTANC